MLLRALASACFSCGLGLAPGLMAQPPQEDLTKERLPKLTGAACKGLEGFQSAGALKMLALLPEPGITAGLFSPAPLFDRLKEAESGLRRLYAASAGSKRLDEEARELLRAIAGHAQTLTEKHFPPPAGRKLTCLVRFSIDDAGKPLWLAFYVLLSDPGVLKDQPSFSAAVRVPNRLSVSILGRDIDREQLPSVLAVGEMGLGPACAVPSAEHLPAKTNGK